VGLECRPDGCEVTGEETPSEPESFGGGNEEEDQDEEEGEVIPSPHSSPPEDLPLPGDHFSQQVRISVGVHWSKRSRTGAKASSDL
jgi:hypothetical protein